MMLDPAVALLIASSAALLFGTAAIHKIRSPEMFAATLREYRLLPALLVPAAGWALSFLELAVSAGLLWQPARAMSSVGGMALLVTYAAAIAVNLARGRRNLDCGCGGFGRHRPIAGWMVLRNLVFAALLGLLLLLPTSTRELGAADAMTIGGGLLIATFLYLASELLLGRPAPHHAGSVRHV